MQKHFFLFKFGYSAGVYGGSAEWYKVIIMEGGEVVSDFIFNGIYTDGQYIRPLLEHNGYIRQRVNTFNDVKISSRAIKKYPMYKGSEELAVVSLFNELKLFINLEKAEKDSRFEILEYVQRVLINREGKK